MTTRQEAIEELSTRVDNDLGLHPPIDEKYSERMDAIREAAKEFAFVVIGQGYVPSREVSQALTKIEEALFHATASIARNQSFDLWDDDGVAETNGDSARR